MVPFEGMPAIAHTMLSFEFIPPEGPPEHLVASVEVRKEEGEKYAAWKGSTRQYELMYVLADERDVIEVRANHRDEDVYLYRTTATPEQARRLLVDVLTRTNELASRPEFYDTLRNNCTTNIARHINRIAPNRIRYDYHILLPGYSDKLAYEEGLIERHGSFEETKTLAYVTPKAIMYAGRLLFPNNFYQDAFLATSVEFIVKNVLPWTQVQRPVGDSDNHFPTHDLPFMVGVGVVFTGTVVMVSLRRRIKRGQLF